MEPKHKSADSFGTFLEIVQGKTSGTQSADQSALRLLTALEQSGPAPVSDLWSKTGLDLTSFAAALKTVKDGGFVTSSGTADAELVEITESGAKVAALARGGP
jgi:DNA-binding MarR family transcriptional regulator